MLSCSWLLLTQNTDKFFTFLCIFDPITRARLRHRIAYTQKLLKLVSRYLLVPLTTVHSISFVLCDFTCQRIDIEGNRR
jgi:hypothetical protein